MSIRILVILAVVVLTIATVTILSILYSMFRRKATKAGYDSIRVYLRAVPRSDEERRDAVDLASTGALLSLLGVIVPPLLLIGVFPLFYGGRKIAYTALGLDLVDDPEPRRG